jgi:hypothetical protein
LTTARAIPASASRSSAWSISGLPATRTSGLGSVSVSGRMRVPSPAAMTIAESETSGFMDLAAAAIAQVSAECWRRTTRRTGASAGCARSRSIAAHTRGIIAGSAACRRAATAGEDADDLGVPLRAEPGVVGLELGSGSTCAR